MKLITNTNYQVTAPDYVSWKLSERYETLNDAVKGGKEMNEEEAKQGFKPSAWIVVKEMWSRTFDDTGAFVSESSMVVKMDIDAFEQGGE